MDEFLKLDEVVRIAGISSSEIYRKIKKGDFPSQCSLGRRCARWKMSDVQAWIASQQPKQAGWQA
ncbi:MAG: AlpA family phage regulatory protein [Thiothrix sp.]|nr:AlpA family phage regulatory protein [Thiothrix sp.]